MWKFWLAAITCTRPFTDCRHLHILDWAKFKTEGSRHKKRLKEDGEERCDHKFVLPFILFSIIPEASCHPNGQGVAHSWKRWFGPWCYEEHKAMGTKAGLKLITLFSYWFASLQPSISSEGWKSRLSWFLNSRKIPRFSATRIALLWLADG